MPEPLSIWKIQPIEEVPSEFLHAVQSWTPGSAGHYAAQLLWQRGLKNINAVAGFVDPKHYQPTSPFAFGAEMHRAVQRLKQAYQHTEQVAIWGDFDADGITATAVLWDGLGQFFSQSNRLTYFIPNRLTESHGLSIHGIQALAQQGCNLIITCDTGSTNLAELTYARQWGIDVIVTDHHTLPPDRPDVTAIINPRALPLQHPLAHLSGVAVAYKLVEALYETLPDIPQKPLEHLLDLVAIGLIADLVELKGDCRYLAQLGIQRLQTQLTDDQPSRPGVARLLQLCRKSGDRPTDISFGVGPRINAISRIHGDACFCVELLTSEDKTRCEQLAEETELANTRRKALQKDVVYQVTTRLAEVDLSTTGVIVLADPQWSVGILGLVAGQIAQNYRRPTILLAVDDNPENDNLSSQGLLARGSARSIDQIDLYQLVQEQAHLLHSFGGHPFAAGLSLPVENIPLFTQAINRQLKEKYALSEPARVVQADLAVTVSELGKSLFQELKLLEPCGMGNPVPKLLIQNCWFTQIWNRNLKDWRGQTVKYIKTEFEIQDASSPQGFPGVWWEHYKDELPTGHCDAIVELDYNAYKKRYELRLIAVRPYAVQNEGPIALQASQSMGLMADWILDWRSRGSNQDPLPPARKADFNPDSHILQITRCPQSWDDLQHAFRQAISEQRPLAIAYPCPEPDSPNQIWQAWVGIAKYLSRTQQPTTRTQLCERLNIGDRTLEIGFESLKQLGFEVTCLDQEVIIMDNASKQNVSKDSHERETALTQATQKFLAAIQEENFRKRYFYTVPLETIQHMVTSGGLQ